MAQTIRKQSELLTNLANNNQKDITAEDIRDVVVSTNGPIMIWSGKVYPNQQIDTDGAGVAPKTTFMNPFYFNTGEGSQGTANTVWQITDSAVVGADNGTYIATSTSQGNFKAKITVASNTVTAFEILDPGYGQRNRIVYNVSFTSNGTKTFEMTYNGAVYKTEDENRYFYFRGKGNDNSYHEPDNTIMQITPCGGSKGEFLGYINDYGNSVFGFYVDHQEANNIMSVSIWKVINA